MKALTVQQPWAWAIVHGGKDVENRTQAWGYRGPLAIHAGARISQRGVVSALVMHAVGTVPTSAPDPVETRAIIGVVDLVDVHVAQHGCCTSPWGEFAQGPTKPVVHLVLERPRALADPIPCVGRLGLWTPSPEITAELEAVTG